jgi:hypothetical protein
MLSMVHDYLISVQIRDGETWSGAAITHSLTLQSSLPNLTVLLKTFNQSENVIRLTVYRTTTLPPITKLRKMTRTELGLVGDDLPKLL